MASSTARAKQQAKAKRPPRAARRKPSNSKLPNAKLLKLAKRNPPPQSWFDATDLPFTPRKD
jgi:hypothetical protein